MASFGLSIMLHIFVLGIASDRDTFYLRLPKMPSIGNFILTERGMMEITGVLGEGTQGTVFEAYWEQGRRKVAIKVERQKLNFENEEKIHNYSHLNYEYWILKQFANTRGFPQVYTALLDGDLQYMVMQNVGRSFKDVLVRDNPRLEVVMNYARQILDRLEAVHKKCYLFPDLHEGNMCVDETGTLYLIDFAHATPFKVRGEHIKQMKAFGKKIPSSRRDDLKMFLKLLIRTLNTTGHSKYLDTLEPACDFVIRMDFENRPDYENLRRLLNFR